MSCLRARKHAGLVVSPRRATTKPARRRIRYRGNGRVDAVEWVGAAQPRPANLAGTLSNFWQHPPLPTVGETVRASPHRPSTEAVTAIGDKWAIPGQTRDGYVCRLALTPATLSGTSPGRTETLRVPRRHRAALEDGLPGLRPWPPRIDVPAHGHKVSRSPFSATAHSSFACWRKAMRTRETLRASRRISAKRFSRESAIANSQGWATAAKAERG